MLNPEPNLIHLSRRRRPANPDQLQRAEKLHGTFRKAGRAVIASIIIGDGPDGHMHIHHERHSLGVLAHVASPMELGAFESPSCHAVKRLSISSV